MNMELTDAQLRKVVTAYTNANGNLTHAAEKLNIKRKTFAYRLKKAKECGMVFGDVPDCIDSCNEVSILRNKVKELVNEVTHLKKERITNTEVREFLFGLKDIDPNPPQWLSQKPKANHSKYNVPCLELSDLHWGEVVKAEQVFHKNEYNLEIANDRMKRLIQNTVEVLKKHMVQDLNFPGMVLCMLGDMVSGDIHEELSKSNDAPLMPAFVDLFNVLVWAIQTLKDEFKRLMIFCTVGNHGRNTKKVPYKDKAYTNFDWLLYTMLERYFQDDSNIQFNIASGLDIQFNIYNHRFRAAHGDQFRGGQGFVGPFAPITRGEIKKRSAAATYDMSYDTLLIGHYHWYMPMGRVIANGSMIGYNEFAIGNDFPYEDPKQALFIVNAKRGITFNVPIFCSDVNESELDEKNWVSWREN